MSRVFELVLLAFVVLRVPALLVVLYLARDVFVDILEMSGWMGEIVEAAIGMMSTSFVRILYVLGFSSILLVFLFVFRRSRTLPVYIGALLIGLIGISFTFHYTQTAKRFIFLPFLLLVTNLLPIWSIERTSLTDKSRSTFVVAGLGIAEVFFFSEYARWLLQSLSGLGMVTVSRLGNVALCIPGLVMTFSLAAILINPVHLVPLEQQVRMSPRARIIAEGDLNWIEIDGSGQYLYVTGHDVENLQRYSLADFASGPRLSAEPTNGAQGFAYDPLLNEIYLYNGKTRMLMYLDGSSLQKRKEVPIPRMPIGDPWIAVDAGTNTITVASEDDSRTGGSFVVLDRESGAILDRRDFDVGNILLHPASSRLFLSFFRGNPVLLSYDLQTRTVQNSTITDSRVDRLAILPERNIILVASPIESKVLRYDAATLEFNGSYDGPFGVRSLGVDHRRSLMLCASLSTGKVAVMDLANGTIISTHFVGPWLRTIEIDELNGVAYISSNGALYSLDYVP